MTAKVKTEVTLRGVEATQHGRRLVMGTMAAQDMALLYENNIVAVDVYSSSNPNGYQRSLLKTRSRRFGRFVGEGGISPTAVLLYVRDPTKFPAKGRDGMYHIPTAKAEYDEPILWIPDGQHRTDGFSEALKEGWLKMDDPFDVPVTVLFWDPKTSPTDPRLEEATQFYTINQEQKRMRTDLAHQYIYRQHETTSGPIGNSTAILRAKKKDYIPYEIYITRRLNDDRDSQWRGGISTPNTKGGVISEGAFTDSLIPIMDYAATAGFTVGEVVELLKHFWSAVFILCGKSRANPEESVLLKTAGVYSLHIFLPTLLIRRANLGKQPSISQLQSVLQAIGDKFTDEFWDSKTGEAVTFGTSHKAFQTLADEITSEL